MKHGMAIGDPASLSGISARASCNLYGNAWTVTCSGGTATAPAVCSMK